MARITKAQLEQQLAAAALRIEQLTAECNALTTECDQLRRQLRTAEAAEQYQAARLKATRPVYEFDPALPGDFTRASQLARANGGTVRRAQRSAH